MILPDVQTQVSQQYKNENSPLASQVEKQVARKKQIPHI